MDGFNFNFFDNCIIKFVGSNSREIFSSVQNSQFSCLQIVGKKESSNYASMRVPTIWIIAYIISI